MSIIGLGIDIVRISRLKKIFNKFGDNFLNRILLKNEKKEFKKKKNDIKFLAKKFSIKEAALKSLGTGWNKYVNFKNIICQNNIYGQPSIKFINIKHNIYTLSTIESIYVSTTDEIKYIVSIVILEK